MSIVGFVTMTSLAWSTAPAAFLRSRTPSNMLFLRSISDPRHRLSTPVKARILKAPQRLSGGFMLESPEPPRPPEPPVPAVPLPDGFMVVHKPMNWTSFDVVGRVRGVLERHFKAMGVKFAKKGGRRGLKVGHGGTLDPMATGLLVLGVGSGTKRMAEYLGGSKAYVARAQLGVETDTQDAEGEEIRVAAFDHVTRSDLERAAAALTGDIMQRPPIYSALRKDGKRLYDLARKGQITEEEVEKRPTTVHRLDVDSYDAESGEFELSISCGGGTYVRTLITDMARDVGSAAYMTALERTKHGPFVTDDEAAKAARDGVAVCAGVQPVRESDFGDPHKLLSAIEEASEALAALQQAADADAEANAGKGTAAGAGPGERSATAASPPEPSDALPTRGGIPGMTASRARRPRGRAPKGQTWCEHTGRWVTAA